MNGELYGAVSLEWGRCAAAVFELGTELKIVERSPDLPTHDPDNESQDYHQETLSALSAWFSDIMLDLEKQKREPIRAIGIASFGPLDRNLGSILETHVPGWGRTNIVSPFQEGLETPVLLDTEMNAAALAEHQLGRGRNFHSLVYLGVGEGIGGGAIVNGHLLHGMRNAEMGHIHLPILPGDTWAEKRAREMCKHGDEKPCVEGLASARSMIDRCGPRLDRIREDDEAWRFEAEYLAMWISTVVMMFAPQKVILGGSLIMKHDFLLDLIRPLVKKRVEDAMHAAAVTSIDSYLVQPLGGMDVSLVGAYLLARAKCATG